MNLLLLALVVGAAPSYTAPVQQDAAAAQAVLERIHGVASRALVQVGDDPGWAGAVLSENGIVATSSQGLKGEKTIAVTFANGYKAGARVVAVDADLGVALLRVDGQPPMAYVPVSPVPAQVSQAAYVVHFVRPLAPTVTFARVASANVSREGRIDDRFLTARFAVDTREHGGPVVSYAGQLIGLLLASDKTGTGFALTGRALLELVAAHAAELPASALSVQSDPSGAEVLLDGNSVGRSPTAIPNVPPGEHLLSVRGPGLPDALRRVVALGPSEQQLALTLFPGSAVRIDAPDGAKVFVDGLLRAAGATTLFLPGGRHVVQATLPGRRAFARQIEVVEDRPLQLVAELPEQRATLTVDSQPASAEVMLDDNRVGATPLHAAKVTPGTYELTITKPGFHTLKRPVTIPDNLDVNLGKLALEAPHLSLAAHAPAQTEIAIDGGPRHPLKPVEQLPPGAHHAVFFSPFQYASVADFRGDDGQTVELSPVFIAAGSPRTRDITHAVSNVVEGGAGIMSLVATGFFLAAETDRENNAGGLSSSGHTSVAVGLTTGGIGLGLYAVSAFIDALQPTPDMGYDHTASGAAVPPPSQTQPQKR